MRYLTAAASRTKEETVELCERKMEVVWAFMHSGDDMGFPLTAVTSIRNRLALMLFGALAIVGVAALPLAAQTGGADSADGSGVAEVFEEAGSDAGTSPSGDTGAPAQPASAQPAVTAPAPVTAAATPRGAAAGGAPGSTGDVNYDLRLRELEGRVNELKEDIFRTKSRLFLLREQILQEGIGGSRLVVIHEDDLSATYTLVRAQFFLDGNLIWSAQEGDEDLRGRAEAFAGSVMQGPHTLSVEYVLRGNDFGVFAYMNGYEFILRSSNTFTVEEGQTVELSVEPFERGGANQPLDERPDVRFVVDSFVTSETTIAAEAE